MMEEHLTNLINALTNLSPSRNTLTQFMLLLPRNYTTIEHSFPEFSDSDVKETLEFLGCEFGDEAKREDGFSEQLYFHVHKIFDWLDDKEVRSNLFKVAKTNDSIPNPYAEWAKLVLEKFLKEPNGDKTVDFLKMLVERQSFIVNRQGYSRGAHQPDWQSFLDKASKKLSVNPAEFEEILGKTVKGRPEYLPDQSNKRIRISLVHDEYHLDLILSEEWTESGISWNRRYDHKYKVRHSETIREILEEVRHE